MSDYAATYTPTTDQVRDLYHLGALDVGPDVDVESTLGMFDRWLNQVRADAWDKGAESAYYDPEIRGFIDWPANPYREVAA